VSPGAKITGSAIASCALSFQSTTPMIAFATWAMIVAPPAAPTASRTLPSGPQTIVGLIELRGRLPPSTRLAVMQPSFIGSRLKSVSSLLR
jgi:hypothetical protein